MNPLSLLSFGSTALAGFSGATSSIMSGLQSSNFDSFQSQHLADAAEYGKAAAAQTDMTMRQQLQQTIGHMMAVRASANTEPGSPTGAAIQARTQQQGDEQRGIQVGNIDAQVGADEQASQMYAQAGQNSLLGGLLNAGLGLGGALLGGLRGPVASGSTS